MVVGSRNIAESAFIGTSPSNVPEYVIHAYYFDQVDVIGFDCRASTFYDAQNLRLINEVATTLKEVSIELKRLRQGFVSNGLVEEISEPLPY